MSGPIEVRGVKIMPSTQGTLRNASIGGMTVALPNGLASFIRVDAETVLQQLGARKVAGDWHLPDLQLAGQLLGALAQGDE